MSVRYRFVRALLLLSLVVAAPAPAQHAAEPNPASPAAREDLLSPDAGEAADDTADASVERFEELRAALAKHTERVRAYDADAAAATGDDRIALQARALQLRLDSVDAISSMVAVVAELEGRELDAKAYREQLSAVLPEIEESIHRQYAVLSEELAAARADASESGAVPSAELSRRVRRYETQQDLILEAAADHLEWLATFELSTESARAWLEDKVSRRARLLAGRVDLGSDRVSDADTRLNATPDDADVQALATAARLSLQESTAALQTVVDLMKRIDMDASSYKQLLIESTGQITADLLDRGVASELLSRWLSGVLDSVAENGPGFVFRALIFALIVWAFWGLSRVVRRVVKKAVEAPHLRFSQLLKRMVVSVVSSAVLLLGVLIALSQLGFEVGPMLAGLGIAGFIVGFALQDTLGNFAAGVMILAYRPYDVGDLIDCAGGVFGKVSHMNLVSTTILTIDNRTRVVPNGKIWGDVITNVTAQSRRRVDLVFGISYSDDIPKAEQVLESIVKEHPKVLDDPEPVVRVHELGDSSVNFVVRPWVARDDYWDVHWDITREVKMRFDREGISIPFPQRDVHFFAEARPATVDLSGAAASQRSGTPASGQDEPEREPES